MVVHVRDALVAERCGGGWEGAVAVGRGRVVGRAVGELEMAVLAVLQAQAQPLSGREVADRLSGPERAYTTVMTVLSRLVTKELAERILSDGGVRYRAADADRLAAREIQALLAAATDRRAVLAHLVADVDDPMLLAELRGLLEEPGPR